MDFRWPLRKTWGGYLNPHYAASAKCDACDGTGSSPEYKRLIDEWYGYAPFDPVAYGATPLTVDHPAIVAFAKRQVERDPGYYGSGSRAIANECQRLIGHMGGQWSRHLIQADVDALLAAGRLMDFTRRPINAAQVETLKAQEAAGGSGYWLDGSNGHEPTADEVNAWSIGGMGHDAINQWVCVKARAKREGITNLDCGRCVDGVIWPSEAVRLAAEAWESSGPPTGDGYQLWETCSGGSPVSPVFATLDELCAYAADNCTTFAHIKTSASEWRRMLDAGYVAHVEVRGNTTMVF